MPPIYEVRLCPNAHSTVWFLRDGHPPELVFEGPTSDQVRAAIKAHAAKASPD